MQPNDPEKMAEYLRWVEWSYDEEVAQVCRERLEDEAADLEDIDPAAFAWECYCTHYASAFEAAERMQHVPFKCDLLLDLEEASGGEESV